MSYLEKLEFSKDWRNPQDFPTYESDETQVRADMQLLHEEAKEALNALVEKLEAVEFSENLPVSAEGLTATTLSAAMAELLATAKAAQAGSIMDGTVSEAKLTEQLQKKINDIDVAYAMNTPTAAENPETGYALGKLWLKPGYTVVNLAGDYDRSTGADWTGENVAKAAEGGKIAFSGTGDSQYGKANATLSATAGAVVRVWLTVEETAGQFASLKVYLNGTEYSLTSGTELTKNMTADADGKVTIQIVADWSNTTTAASGKFSITGFAAVNRTAANLPGAMALTDGTLDAMVAENTPFSRVETRLEVYGQQTAGVWKRLVPDEALSSDELTVTDALATKAGLEGTATLSELLLSVQNSIARIEAAINGETEGYVWNTYRYEKREAAATLAAPETSSSPTNGYFRFTVASSIALNASTGEITLVSPAAVSRNPVAGEYFTCEVWNYSAEYVDVAGVYRWESGAAIAREQTGYANGAGIYSYFLRGAVKVYGSLEYQGIVTAAAANAYPEDGWVNETRYISAPKSQLSTVGKCAIGQYNGTGGYGAGSPCSITCSFVPKTIEILSWSLYDGKYVYGTPFDVVVMSRLSTEYVQGVGFCYVNVVQSGNTSFAKKSADGKTLYWYNTTDARVQCNESGNTYWWRALG